MLSQVSYWWVSASPLAPFFPGSFLRAWTLNIALHLVGPQLVFFQWLYARHLPGPRPRTALLAQLAWGCELSYPLSIQISFWILLISSSSTPPSMCPSWSTSTQEWPSEFWLIGASGWLAPDQTLCSPKTSLNSHGFNISWGGWKLVYIYKWWLATCEEAQAKQNQMPFQKCQQSQSRRPVYNADLSHLEYRAAGCLIRINK